MSADAAAWIADVVSERAPQAKQCMDPFHVVQWASEALDLVRREKWNELRSAGAGGCAKDLKNARWALWKNPENLSGQQARTLSWVAKSNQTLYRAYLLKESLRSVFHLPFAEATERLDGWLKWAARSRLWSFVKLGKSIRAYKERITAALLHGLSNALAEAENTQLRLLVRQAFGFHNVQAFINLACSSWPGSARHFRGDHDPRKYSERQKKMVGETGFEAGEAGFANQLMASHFSTFHP